MKIPIQYQKSPIVDDLPDESLSQPMELTQIDSKITTGKEESDLVMPLNQWILLKQFPTYHMMKSIHQGLKKE